ncbi:MAG: hypothetical protein KGH91_02400 [Rhodospirillales bacterium]|nr:hypothetical protein [Rhodospirillales bacterium]
MRIPRIFALPGFCPAVHHADVSRMTAALGPAPDYNPAGTLATFHRLISNNRARSKSAINARISLYGIMQHGQKTSGTSQFLRQICHMFWMLNSSGVNALCGHLSEECVHSEHAK